MKWRRSIGVAAVIATSLWAAFVTRESVSHYVEPPARAQRLGFDSIGGGTLGGGGGISKVTADSPLGGSGTSSNHLTLTLVEDDPVAGTGSSGSHLRFSPTVATPIQGTGSSGSAFAIQSSPTFTGTATVAGLIDSGDLAVTGVVTASALSGTSADWDPTGGGTLAGITLVREAPSAAATVRGLVAGSSGQLLAILNTSTSFSLSLTNEDGSESTAARRFTLPNAGTFIVSPGGGVLLRYSPTTSRWTAWSSAITTCGTSESCSGSTINLNIPAVTCDAGSGATAIAANGTITCSAKVSTVSAGSGMTISTSSGAVTAAVNAGSGITADGTNTRANIGAGIQFIAGAIATNIGGSCTNGTKVTSISAAGVVTCTNPNRDPYTGTVQQFQDEFDQASLSSQYTVATSGGANGSIASPTAGTRYGIMQISTGTAATGRYGVERDATNDLFFGGGTWDVEWDITTEALDDGTDKYSIQAGFIDTNTSVNNVDGCYFLYDRSNVATAPGTGAGNTSNFNKWACLCTSNSVRTEYVMDGTVVSASSFTTVNAPVVANTYDRLEVIVNAAATEADFYVAGVLSCKITTNIPSGASRATSVGIAVNKSAGTTVNEKVDMDRLYGRIDYTTARTP